MSYIDLLPIELNTIILSYFDYKNYHEGVSIIFNVDYYQLLILNFPQYYDKCIVDYNPRKLYEYFIYHTEYISKSPKKEFVVGYNRYDFYKYYSYHRNQKDMHEYLLKIGKINYNLDRIAKLDDVDAYIRCKNDTYEHNKFRTHLTLLNNNSCNILEYMSDNNDPLLV